jgi:protein involved in polysaccharide export with SLBB domain
VTTVLDVLAQAGGFNQFANRSRIVILRPNGKAMTRIPFNYNKAITSGGDEENFYLQPGDIVLVP